MMTLLEDWKMKNTGNFQVKIHSRRTNNLQM